MVLFQTVLSLASCSVCGWFWLKAPGRAGSAKFCLSRLRSTGWIPAVLPDASAPVELAVLVVTDQLGSLLLVWWCCGLKEAMAALG